MRRVNLIRRLAIALVAFVGGTALAEITVKDAWVRGTVPAQTATGAFMKLYSTEEAKIVAASSPAAKVVEIHEMAMKGGTMQMRALAVLPLPAKKVVELKSGGYHLMLMELAKPLSKGDTVPITFTIEDAAGKRTQLEVRAEVRPLVIGPSTLQHKH